MKVVVVDELVGLRLDVLVAQEVEGINRSYAQVLISDKKVLVNGNPTKGGYRVRLGDTVEILYDPATLTDIPTIELPVLYEDDDTVVIDKPIGVLTHSKGAFNPEATVATWLAEHTHRVKEPGRDGIVHRLDRATSGVMICAKTEEAHHFLQKQFSTRNVKKTYVAVAEGMPAEPQAILRWPIERNPKAPQTFRVGANGKMAETAYQLLHTTQDDTFSVVELRPLTGRTHQLRVHLSYLGNPIYGDTLYGGEAADRMYLHALSLEITLPSRERKTFIAPLPDEFTRLTGYNA